MASERESERPSGPGQALKLAAHTAQGLASGDPSSLAVKAATLKQLTAMLAILCARPGFPTVNRHLRMEELAGLGWLKLQALIDDPQKGKDALATAISALVTSSHACKLYTAGLANLQPQMRASTALSISIGI